MHITEIKRKGYTKKVAVMKVSELDLDKCSSKFLKCGFEPNYEVAVLLDNKGNLDLRGKNRQYRIYEILRNS